MPAPLSALVALLLLAAPASAGGYGDEWLINPDPTDRPLYLEEHPEMLGMVPEASALPACGPEDAKGQAPRLMGPEGRFGRLRAPIEGAIEGAINWGRCKVPGLNFAF